MEFPAEFLERLKTRLSMPTVIQSRVKLVRSGRQWKACCPFHGEKTPSFYVYDDHFHCFGCGKHGDIIEFLMELDSKPYEEVVQSLAAIAKLPAPAPHKKDESSDILHKAVKPMHEVEKSKIVNQSNFSDDLVEAIFATTAKLLVNQRQVAAASLLANGGGRVFHWEHDSWDGGYDTWRLLLTVPAAVYFELDGKEDRENEINNALRLAMEGISSPDVIAVKIATALDSDPDWRAKVRQHVSGEGITNQGRVRSGNIAAREHDGLLFRSKPEVEFYNALKRSGVAFAPLSVVLHGGITYLRVEPDFVIYKDGVIMIVEIDGDLYHSENPAAAHARLKFMTDEGAKLERISALECNTPQKAQEAVARVLDTIEKHRRAR